MRAFDVPASRREVTVGAVASFACGVGAMSLVGYMGYVASVEGRLDSASVALVLGVLSIVGIGMFSFAWMLVFGSKLNEGFRSSILYLSAGFFFILPAILLVVGIAQEGYRGLIVAIVIPLFWKIGAASVRLARTREKKPNKSAQRNAGSRPASDDSPASETPSEPAARGRPVNVDQGKKL